MMRARLTSLLLATACVAGIGCVSQPTEAPSADAALDQACTTSPTALRANDHDTDIDSILTQPTSDPRLAQINRRMYQSLRMLDAELRREQRAAACQHPLESATLQAQTNNQQDASGGAGAAGQSGGDSGVAAGAAVGAVEHATADGGIGSSAITASSSASSSNSAAGTGAAAPGATAAHAATSIRKASLSNGRGGNGASAPKVVPGSDNDIVARRLRKAAEQETNPTLRAKLWKEYTDYRQGMSTK